MARPAAQPGEPSAADGTRWLAVVAQLPVDDATGRMKVLRMLETLGCAVLRDGVYLLPDSPASRQGLQRLVDYVARIHGSAHLLAVQSADEAQTRQFRGMFDRSTQYRELVKTVESLKAGFGVADPAAIRHVLMKQRQALEAIGTLDFFGSPLKAKAGKTLAEMGDAHGLGFFDGTRLYEHPDPRVGYHQDWKSYVFNYGRPEVQSFLVSSALYWIERFHVDAIRVDAVASMLYLDYSRAAGEWLPNRYGGLENLEAIEFLRELNSMVHLRFPGAVTIAEESTAWPQVSRPIEGGGLGFSMKWNMGWMHDTLAYFRRDPVHRRHHHRELTFGQLYAYTENFVLPLSHDEVVHGKGSLIGKMPGRRVKQIHSAAMRSSSTAALTTRSTR